MNVENFITIGVSMVVGIGSSYLTFRLQFERFRAMDERREQDWMRWRNKIDIDIEQLKQTAGVTELALLRQAVDMLTKRVEQLWDYATELKHVHVDPYVREIERLKQRVESMDRG